MRTVADLHSHSFFSDGSMTLDLVHETITNRNLIAFSVTDHDRIDFYDQDIKPELKPYLVPGVELSTRLENQSVHLLVYHPWPISIQFRQLVSEFSDYRKQRYMRICHSLAKDYPQLSWQPSPDQKVFTARQLCEFIASKTGNQSLNTAYDKFLSRLNMNYAEFPPLHHLLEKLQAIPRAKSFIAHPGYKGKQWEKFWKDWKSLGLSGLELIHPSHKGPLRKYYKKIIRRENLIAVGGSDFHFSGGGRIGPGKLGLDFHQWKNFNDQCQLLHNNHLVDKNLPETATIIRSPEDKNELSE